MSDHTGNIFKAFKDLEFKDTVSHQCGEIGRAHV